MSTYFSITFKQLNLFKIRMKSYVKEKIDTFYKYNINKLKRDIK